MKTKMIIASALLALASGSAFSAELKVGSANMPSYLDPGRDHSNVGSQFYYNTFDVLIDKDADKAESSFRPGLATEWKLIEPTVMELKLRDDVYFQNGDKMTADLDKRTVKIEGNARLRIDPKRANR